MTNHVNRTIKLDLQLTAADKAMLQSAAAGSHKTLNGFVVESALLAAQHLLGERTAIRLDPQPWETSQEMVDPPPKALPGLVRLLKESGTLD